MSKSITSLVLKTIKDRAMEKNSRDKDLSLLFLALP
jgi:hypothetical protein